MKHSALLDPGYSQQQDALTLTVVHMNNGISVLEGIGNTSDKTLGSLRSSVDSNKTERPFRAGHSDV
jgi:hypothetical protein